MSNKLFSEEEVARLTGNPNVESISSRSIVFTPAFKQEAYEQLHGGMKMQEILLEHGIDPLILGKARVNGLREKIEIASKRPDGFANLRKTRSMVPPESREKCREESLQKQIRELKQELAYTRQEVEFLKKIRMADLEARKKWESEQKQK